MKTLIFYSESDGEIKRVFKSQEVHKERHNTPENLKTVIKDKEVDIDLQKEKIDTSTREIVDAGGSQ